jgi:hypothetical protein
MGAESENCWYCSRVGQRQLPSVPFFPLVPTPNGQGKWLGLHDRFALLESNDPKSKLFFEDAPLPSIILLKEWQASHELTIEMLDRLVAVTNLDRASIVNYFRKKNDARVIEERAQIGSDSEDEPLITLIRW